MRDDEPTTRERLWQAALILAIFAFTFCLTYEDIQMLILSLPG